MKSPKEFNPMQPFSHFLAAGNEADSVIDYAEFKYLNVAESREIRQSSIAPALGSSPLVIYISPREWDRSSRQEKIGDPTNAAMGTPASAASRAVEIVRTVYKDPEFAAFRVFESAATVLEELSASGNCSWTLHETEGPDTISMIYHLISAAIETGNPGLLGKAMSFARNDRKSTYRHLDSRSGNYILSFENKAVWSLKLTEGMSILIPKSSGSDFLQNVVGLFLLGWTACMAGIGMVLVWALLRPARVLGRASLEAGEIVRADDDVPRKLENLAERLPEGTLAIREYRSLLQGLASLQEEREFWLGEMLHYVKNDLNSVILGLSEAQGGPGDLGRVLPDMDKATGRIRDMLNNVASYQWTQFGKPEEAGPIDLGSLLETIVDDIIDAGGDAACTGHEEIRVLARKEALQSALQNLIWNAHHHGGALAVTVGTMEEREAVEIVIDDDGPGIPEDEMAIVFKPYRKGNRDKRASGGFVGAGLGLSIARRVISDHGGEISLENRRAAAGGIEGLRVRVALPLNGPVTAETGG